MGLVKGNVPSSMRKMWSFTPFCTGAKSHPGICSPLKHSIVPNNSVSGQRRLGSDCADAQSDQGLRCLHLPEDPLSHGETQMISFAFMIIIHPIHTTRLLLITLGRLLTERPLGQIRMARLRTSLHSHESGQDLRYMSYVLHLQQGPFIV